MTENEASDIAVNVYSNKWTLILYTGEELNCVPYHYDYSSKKLRVSLLKDRSELEVGIDLIVKSKQILPNSIGHIFTENRLLTFQGEYATKLIIIGAGASYGYNTINTKREPFHPPLANDIFSQKFDEFLDGFQGAKNFASNSNFTTDIEHFFQKNWDRVSNYSIHDEATLLSLINTQYYLSSLFLKISSFQKGNRYNLYQNLIQLINEYLSNKKKGEKVLIVSFNYDTLLEEALESFKHYTFNDVNEYVDYKNRDILVFKPHGSCNWFREMNISQIDSTSSIELNLAQTSKYLFKNRLTLGEIQSLLSKETKVFNTTNIDTRISRGIAYYPQLLIPYKRKDEFSMPNRHKDILTHMLNKVNDTLVIGWKGTESKFKELLKNSLNGNNMNLYYANYTDTSIEAEYKELFPNGNIHDVSTFFAEKDKSKWENARADFMSLIKYLNTEDNFFFK